jgi:hypothetical protein
MEFTRPSVGGFFIFHRRFFLTSLHLPFTLSFVSREMYQKALRVAKKELQALLKERADLDTRISQLKQTVTNLAVLTGESSALEDPAADPSEGISNGIRRALFTSSVPLTPPQIRDALVKAGFSMEYSSVLTVIHNTLKRLEKQGEVVQTPSGWTVKK